MGGFIQSPDQGPDLHGWILLSDWAKKRKPPMSRSLTNYHLKNGHFHPRPVKIGRFLVHPRVKLVFGARVKK